MIWKTIDGDDTDNNNKHWFKKTLSYQIMGKRSFWLFVENEISKSN